MLRPICAGICASLFCSTLPASTVFRCEDASGHVTYTLQGCPTDASQDLQSADNPTPGQGKAVPMAKVGKGERKREKPASELLVVGAKQDGCGNRVAGSERRTAMIRQQVRTGMTQADVQSSLGTPDKVTSQDGQTRYHYEDKDGNRRQVTFDEAGCVKGKR